MKWLPAIAEIAEACDTRLGIMKSTEELRATVERWVAIVDDPTASDAAKDNARHWLKSRKDLLKRLGADSKFLTLCE